MTNAAEKSEVASDKVLKALNWKPPKKITQASFDESVQDNIDALGLEPDEAVESAIEEFKMQDIDLSDIIQTPEGADVSRHAVQLAFTEVMTLLPDVETSSSFEQATAEFKKLLLNLDGTPRQEGLAVAHRVGALKSLLLCQKYGELPESRLLTVLEICALLLQTAAIRDSFAEKSLHDGRIFDGPNTAAAVLREHGEDDALAIAVGNMCKGAATECEDSKCKLMDSTFPREALELLKKDGLGLPTAEALCDALKCLMFHDDFRPPTSKAFVHARVMAAELHAVPVMLKVMAASVHEPSSFKAIILAVQQLCANDDICKQVCDAEGVQLVIKAIQQYFNNAGVVAAACGLLRQLAKSDDIKVLVVRLEGLELILSILDTHKSSAKVMVQVLGLLATLLLRHPDHCEAAFNLSGILDQVLDAMRAHITNAGPNRQACQVLRNMVARNKEYGPRILEKGVEALLRKVKCLDECDDVAVGAMRDLGVDKYNE